MSGADLVVLRAERRCEASDVALVLLKCREERPLFASPGIWRHYNGPVKKNGPNADIETYAFLTTTPNSLLATINHERMPVLLTREEEFDTWLRGPTDEAFALAASTHRSRCTSFRKALSKEDRVAI